MAPVADSPDSRTRAADISTRAAGAVSDISVSDSLVTFPSAGVEVSVGRSDTDRDSGQVSDTAQGWATSVRQMSDTVPSEASDTLSDSLNGSATTQALTGQSRPTTDTATITPGSCGAGPDRMSDSPGAVPDGVADKSDACPPAFADMSATLASDRKRLSDAVDIVQTHGHLSGSDMARQMGRSGHHMSERTGLRWRDRAEDTDGNARPWPLPPPSAAIRPPHVGIRVQL
jgi:hypothetical protein